MRILSSSKSTKSKRDNLKNKHARIWMQDWLIKDMKFHFLFLLCSLLLLFIDEGIGLEDFVHPSSWTVISARENMTNVTTVTCVLHDPSNRSRRIITQWFQRNSIGEQRKLLPDNPLVLFHGDPQPNNNLFTTYRNLLTIVSFGPEFHNSTLECGFNTDPISSYPLLVFSPPGNPSGLQANEVGDTWITFVWQQPSNLGLPIISNYELSLTAGNSSQGENMTYSTNRTTISLRIEELLPMTTYSAATRTVTRLTGSTVFGDYTDEVIATTLPPTDFLVFRMDMNVSQPCQDWIDNSTDKRLEDIANETHSDIEQFCECSYRREYLFEARLTCIQPHELSVQFTAKLLATATFLTSEIEEFQSQFEFSLPQVTPDDSDVTDTSETSTARSTKKDTSTTGSTKTQLVYIIAAIFVTVVVSATTTITIVLLVTIAIHLKRRKKVNHKKTYTSRRGSMEVTSRQGIGDNEEQTPETELLQIHDIPTMPPSATVNQYDTCPGFRSKELESESHSHTQDGVLELEDHSNSISLTTEDNDPEPFSMYETITVSKNIKSDTTKMKVFSREQNLPLTPVEEKRLGLPDITEGNSLSPTYALVTIKLKREKSQKSIDAFEALLEQEPLYDEAILLHSNDHKKAEDRCDDLEGLERDWNTDGEKEKKNLQVQSSPNSPPLPLETSEKYEEVRSSDLYEPVPTLINTPTVKMEDTIVSRKSELSHMPESASPVHDAAKIQRNYASVIAKDEREGQEEEEQSMQPCKMQTSFSNSEKLDEIKQHEGKEAKEIIEEESENDDSLIAPPLPPETIDKYILERTGSDSEGQLAPVEEEPGQTMTIKENVEAVYEDCSILDLNSGSQPPPMSWVSKHTRTSNPPQPPSAGRKKMLLLDGYSSLPRRRRISPSAVVSPLVTAHTLSPSSHSSSAVMTRNNLSSTRSSTSKVATKQDYTERAHAGHDPLLGGVKGGSIGRKHKGSLGENAPEHAILKENHNQLEVSRSGLTYRAMSLSSLDVCRVQTQTGKTRSPSPFVGGGNGSGIKKMIGQWVKKSLNKAESLVSLSEKDENSPGQQKTSRFSGKKLHVVSSPTQISAYEDTKYETMSGPRLLATQKSLFGSQNLPLESDGEVFSNLSESALEKSQQNREYEIMTINETGPMMSREDRVYEVMTACYHPPVVQQEEVVYEVMSAGVHPVVSQEGKTRLQEEKAVMNEDEYEVMANLRP